jgi:hypothetical protein
LGEIADHAAPDAFCLVVARLGNPAAQCQHERHRVRRDSAVIDTACAGRRIPSVTSSWPGNWSVPALEPVLAKLWAAYRRHGLTARTVTVKIKFANFRLITRARSCSEAIMSRAIIEQISRDLLQPHFSPSRGVRLLGVTLSNFHAATIVAENRQPALALP